jgi:hypothetical protein
MLGDGRGQGGRPWHRWDNPDDALQRVGMEGEDRKCRLDNPSATARKRARGEARQDISHHTTQQQKNCRPSGITSATTLYSRKKSHAGALPNTLITTLPALGEDARQDNLYQTKVPKLPSRHPSASRAPRPRHSLTCDQLAMGRLPNGPTPRLRTSSKTHANHPRLGGYHDEPLLQLAYARPQLRHQFVLHQNL